MPGLHNKSLSPKQNSKLRLFVFDLPVKLVFLSFSVLFVFGCDKLHSKGWGGSGLCAGLPCLTSPRGDWSWYSAVLRFEHGSPNRCLKYNSCSWEITHLNGPYLFKLGSDKAPCPRLAPGFSLLQISIKFEVLRLRWKSYPAFSVCQRKGRNECLWSMVYYFCVCFNLSKRLFYSLTWFTSN